MAYVWQLRSEDDEILRIAGRMYRKSNSFGIKCRTCRLNVSEHALTQWHDYIKIVAQFDSGLGEVYVLQTKQGGERNEPLLSYLRVLACVGKNHIRWFL